MPKVTIIDGANHISLSAETGAKLEALLQEHVLSFAMPCAGNHTCGKCLIQIEGSVSPAGEEELELLKKVGAQTNLRLACFCAVEGDLTVTIPSARQDKILSWYKTPEIDATETGYGFAVDIGTTTVAMQLIDRATGLVLAEQVAKNSQAAFGADVISRVESCKTAGLEALSSRIHLQLEEMAAACLAESHVTKVEESVVTGNTIMLHIYEGLDPAPLAVAPFTVQSYFGCMSRHTLAGAPVYLPRCIGAYVGADITCAILASDIVEQGSHLLADIGTNGEVALATEGKLLCCSTAAGPAFEGAGLSRGMTAGSGAIRAVTLTSEGVAYETVHNTSPAGICGSGVLDALAVMLETGDMEESGHLDADWEIGDSGISITQQDIRQIQLAKAAICGGIMTLLEQENISAEDLDRFVVAGGFGGSINHTSAAAIGLYPEALSSKADFCGNGALGGAVLLLRSHPLRETASRFASEAVELSLSASPEFMDQKRSKNMQST